MSELYPEIPVVEFDFARIDSVDQFYQLAAEKLHFPDYFGENLDALWDVLTGDIDLPVSIVFRNLNHLQLLQFESVISVFHDAAREMPDDFYFDCRGGDEGC